MIKSAGASQKSASCILNHLESIYVWLTYSHIKGITIIKPWWHKSMDHSLTLEMTKKLLAFDSNLNWKKLDLTTELICLSNLSAESKLTPRFLTDSFLQVSRAPKSQSGAPEDPNTMASVLPSFREPDNNRPITRAQCVSAAVKQDQMLNLCLYLESQQMCRGPSEPIHAPKN